MCLNVSACPKKEVHVLYRNTFITRFLRLFVPKSTSIVFVPKLLFRKLRGIAVHPTSLCAKIAPHYALCMPPFTRQKTFPLFQKRTITRAPRASKSSKNIMKQILLLIKIHLGGVVVFSISNLIINLTAHEVTKEICGKKKKEQKVEESHCSTFYCTSNSKFNFIQCKKNNLLDEIFAGL